MKTTFTDKNGNPLRGAALQSKLIAEAKKNPFSDCPELVEYLEDSSPEEVRIISETIIAEGRKQLARRNGIERLVSITTAATSVSFLAGFIVLLARPQYVGMGMFLGAGIGATISTTRLLDE